MGMAGVDGVGDDEDAAGEGGVVGRVWEEGEWDGGAEASQEDGQEDQGQEGEG